jgi:hypothetical protein
MRRRFHKALCRSFALAAEVPVGGAGASGFEACFTPEKAKEMSGF